MIQTIAVYVVRAGFTGRLFTSAALLLTGLLSFSTGPSVGTYFVVIPILFPVGVMVGVEPNFMIGAIVSGAAFGEAITVAPASIPFVNFYAIAMVIVLAVSVVTGYGRKSKIDD